MEHEQQTDLSPETVSAARDTIEKIGDIAKSMAESAMSAVKESVVSSSSKEFEM